MRTCFIGSIRPQSTGMRHCVSIKGNIRGRLNGENIITSTRILNVIYYIRTLSTLSVNNYMPTFALTNKTGDYYKTILIE